MGKAGRLVQAPLLSPFIGQKLRSLTVKHNSADLITLKSLIEAGKVAPILGETFQLTEVPKAFRYLKEGHARGKIAIKV